MHKEQCIGPGPRGRCLVASSVFQWQRLSTVSSGVTAKTNGARDSMRWRHLVDGRPRRDLADSG